jgi:hypothetical protein
MSTEEHPPLPISKPTRVVLEAVRTAAACSAVVINCVALVRVFGLI